MSDPGEYLTTFEAAAMLRVSRSTLQHARTWREYNMRKGDWPAKERNNCSALEHIPFFKPVGGKVLYRRADLQRFLDQMEAR